MAVRILLYVALLHTWHLTWKAKAKLLPAGLVKEIHPERMGERGKGKNKKIPHNAGDTASAVNKNAVVVKAARQLCSGTFPKNPSKMVQQHGSMIKDGIAKVKSLLGNEEWTT